MAANSFDAHYAIIQLELSRLTIRSDLGDLKRSFDQSSDLALQDASTETRGIYNDFFQLKTKELYDSATHNKAAVQLDRAQETQFKQYYNQIHGIERQILQIKQQFNNRLNAEGREADHLFNLAEKNINKGADPGTVLNTNNVQIGKLGERVGRIVMEGTGQFGRIHNEIQQLAQATFEQPGTPTPNPTTPPPTSSTPTPPLR
ncbi:MAG: hypothetical protein NVSMB14_13160 [Isosphaeraceae bacterium]